MEKTKQQNDKRNACKLRHFNTKLLHNTRTNTHTPPEHQNLFNKSKYFQFNLNMISICKNNWDACMCVICCFRGDINLSMSVSNYEIL